MKFKIIRSELENLLLKTDKNSFEINLELESDTCREAMIIENIKNEWWQKGYERGFQEGLFARENQRSYSFNGCYGCKNLKF